MIPLAANFTLLKYLNDTDSVSAVIPIQQPIPFAVNFQVEPNMRIISLTIEDLAGKTLAEQTTSGPFSTSLSNFNMPKTIVRGGTNSVSWTLDVNGPTNYYSRLEYSPSEVLIDDNRSNLLWIPLGVLDSIDPGKQELLFDTLQSL